MINLTIETLNHFLKKRDESEVKIMILFKTILSGWIYALSEQKQTGLLKMHIHFLPVEGALERHEYRGSPGNSCKQNSTHLIKYSLSGKMEMPSKLFWRQSVPFRG